MPVQPAMMLAPCFQQLPLLRVLLPAVLVHLLLVPVLLLLVVVDRPLLVVPCPSMSGSARGPSVAVYTAAGADADEVNDTAAAGGAASFALHGSARRSICLCLRATCTSSCCPLAFSC